ncbi:MAG: hypothetical protein A2X86_02585 [Bdellovibrionales bacterium GWA2_49_15]|nr:MAG: hypothetical protein A2X86_02585 [Bdellovibrionales bacterium GWA2_49_15]HAZ14175.1 hypothetical protein [Bdellovibrionales bacterium]
MHSKYILPSFLLFFIAYSSVIQFDTRAKRLEFEQQLTGHDKVERALEKVLQKTNKLHVRIKKAEF